MAQPPGIKADTLEYCAPDLAAQVGKWMIWLKVEKNVSRHTLRAYTSDFGQFLHFLSNHHGAAVSISHLSAASLSDFRAWMSAKATGGAAASSRARSLSGIKNFLTWLDKQGIAHNAALAGVRAPKLPKNCRGR